MRNNGLNFVLPDFQMVCIKAPDRGRWQAYYIRAPGRPMSALWFFTWVVVRLNSDDHIIFVLKSIICFSETCRNLKFQNFKNRFQFNFNKI
jgi:hypothetical protein